ncbi:MAG: hypothetical protein Q9186_005897, partial [Xanthomendoza sp. 1 TL-2023]
MKYYYLHLLPIAILSFTSSYASPVSRLRIRQDVTHDQCVNPEASLDARCWDLANIPDYLNNPNTGWNHTIPICDDSTKCCTDNDDGWSTCFLRLAQVGVDEDCTNLNGDRCKSGKNLAPDLHPSIVAPNAAAQALGNVVGITEYFDPKKESQTSLFAVLGALSVGLAFLTAPTVAAGMLAAQASNAFKFFTSSTAVVGTQVPGVGRSLWPTGTDTTTIYQIGQLQEKVSDIQEALSNRLSQALGLLMTDPVTFAAFADHGKYIPKGPPLDPNEVKNALALSLQTYLTSASMKYNG